MPFSLPEQQNPMCRGDLYSLFYFVVMLRLHFMIVVGAEDPARFCLSFFDPIAD